MYAKIAIVSLLFMGAHLAAAPSLNYTPPTVNRGKSPPPIEGVFGPEFTFTYNGGVPDEVKNLFLANLRNHLTVNQPPLARFTETSVGGYVSLPKFTSPNGWWFEVTLNPGVLEIKMSPLTVKDTYRFKGDIQDALFVTAANSGLFPWDYLGGGHLNFDLGIFGNRILFLRNFIVDFWNHTELSMGILNFDTNNAVPFPLFNAEEREKIKHVIALADAGAYPDTPEGVREFLVEINKIQGSASNRLGDSSKGKHHDLNFLHPGRIEIRSVRPQANMDIWYNQIKLIESRINNHLRHIDHPILFNPSIPEINAGLVGREHLNGPRYVPPIDAQVALRRFYQYVNEAHLEWKDHRNYIWPPWFREGELEKFESTNDFKNKEKQNSLRRRARAAVACRDALAP